MPQHLRENNQRWPQAFELFYRNACDETKLTIDNIVTDNAIKDAINIAAVQSYARRTHQKLHWYYAIDKTNGAPFTDNDLQSIMENYFSGQTNQRLGKIPLVSGMKVIVSHNFDVQGGIVNGSLGVLRQIRYYTNSQNKRILKSCIVEIPDADPTPINDLPPCHFPILPDEISIPFTHPYSNEKLTIKRTQVPIQPVWAVEKVGMGASGSGQTSVGVETTVHCKYLAEAVCRYEVNTQE